MKNKIWIIKAGGELLANHLTRKKILKDLAIFAKAKSVLFVHGGGPQIEAELKRAKIKAHFSGGRRVTSPEAMTVVERVLSGEINKMLSAELALLGCNSVGLSCRDGGLITAKPILGLGRAAKPVRVNVSYLQKIFKAGLLAVVSTVGSDSKGQAVNINADDAASAIARALKAENLTYLTNISGVRDAQNNRIAVLATSQIDHLIDNQVISGGMIPKVQSARAALFDGIQEINIVNGTNGINFNAGTKIIKR